MSGAGRATDFGLYAAFSGLFNLRPGSVWEAWRNFSAISAFPFPLKTRRYLRVLLTGRKRFGRNLAASRRFVYIFGFPADGETGALNTERSMRFRLCLPRPQNTKSSPTPADCRSHVAYYRRVFARGCGKHPTTELKLALDRAAYAAADAWRVRTDPTIPDAVRIAIMREERLCMKALAIAKERNQPAKPKPAPSLQELLAGVR